MTLEQMYDLVRALLLLNGIVGVVMVVGLVVWKDQFKR